MTLERVSTVSGTLLGQTHGLCHTPRSEDLRALQALTARHSSIHTRGYRHSSLRQTYLEVRVELIIRYTRDCETYLIELNTGDLRR